MVFFIDWQTTLECAIIALFFASLLTLALFKPLGVLQSCGYKCGEFFRWARRKNNLIFSRYSLLALSCLLCCAVLALCFSFAKAYADIISLAAYLIFFVTYIFADARYSFRGGAVLTKRFKRLLAAVWVVIALATYLAASLLNFADYVWGEKIFSYLKYCALSLIPLTALPLAAFANLITLIWEKPINSSFVKKAKTKLEKSDVTIIGITGSYGKTGVKNILNTMLSKKFEVVATPASYNTPLGIARTVNGNDLPAGSVFIAEMGARNVGDIAELCSICPPDWSVITGICPQHLESFKSLEAIVSTKGEIITATKNRCFVAAAAYDYFKSAGDKVKGCDCVSEVVSDCTGTGFTLTLGGESVKVKTKLLGAHSANNVGLCAEVAYALGVSIEQIAEAVGELEFTEHRLQLLQANGVNILDDGYNSNVAGAKAAIEVLRSFGGNKICVTPGLVELGVLEESENRQLGENLVGLDYIILVGETLVEAVKNGYLDAGGDPEKITVVPTLKIAQDKIAQIILKGDCVLFLNDLPEKYM